MVKTLHRFEYALVACRVAYVGLILLATLTELRFDPDLTAAWWRLGRALTPTLNSGAAVDGIRNVTLFAGLGVVWVVTARSGRVWPAVRGATAIGCLMSITVETVQLFSPARFASVLDLGTDTIGTLTGAVVVVIFAFAIRGYHGRRPPIGVPAFVFAGAYCFAALLEALAPHFRQEQLAAIKGNPLNRVWLAVAAVQPASLAAIPALDILLFFPSGFFCVPMLVERGSQFRDAWWRVALVGAVLSLGVEVAHGVLRYPITLGAVLAHGVGIALGAWSAQWIPPLTRRLPGQARAVGLMAVYAVILALWAWRPFALRSDLPSIVGQLSASHLIPMMMQTERTDTLSVADVAIQFLLYLPLGALLAVWPLRARGPLASVLPAFYLSAALEVSQIFVADRYFDTTDLLVQCAGAAVGWIVMGRSGFGALGEALGPRRTNPR